MKTYLISILLITLLSICFVSSAQRICGVEVNLDELKKSNPKEYKAIMDLEEFTKNNTSTIHQRISDPNGKIVIPVVVHILHGNSSIGTNQNLSDAQILSQIDVLNEDFQNMNADKSLLPSGFKTLLGNAKISFCLVKYDKNQPKLCFFWLAE